MLLLRYIWGLLFCVLVVGAALAFKTILPLIGQSWWVFQFFFLGMVAYVIFMGLNESLFKVNSKLFRTFTHELTHTLFSWLMLKEVRNFRVSHYSGGEVTIVGGTNMLILLSPYCIPIFTIVCFLVMPFISSKFLPILELVIGFTYAFHLHTFLLQTGLRQTDITKYPLLTSFSFIALFHLLFAGILLMSFQLGISALWEFPSLVVENIIYFLKPLLHS